MVNSQHVHRHAHAGLHSFCPSIKNTCMHTRIYIYIYTYIHVHAGLHSFCWSIENTCMHTSIYMYIYIYIYTYIHANACRAALLLSVEKKHKNRSPPLPVAQSGQNLQEEIDHRRHTTNSDRDSGEREAVTQNMNRFGIGSSTEEALDAAIRALMGTQVCACVCVCTCTCACVCICPF
jgi:hypothetical protein